ncbi:MAG: alpha/beta hydrolase [Bacteroidetes bacterium]|nr:alpha/beta hydrolase [Bacteroidota bacterium]
MLRSSPITEPYNRELSLCAKEPGVVVNYKYRVKTVNINEIELAFTDTGRPKNKTLIFLHGIGSGIPVWDNNIDELSKTSRCIAIDLPGHGYSKKSDFTYSMDFYAGILNSFISTLQLKNVVVVGHSMGAQIAVIAAFLKPELIKNLVLVSPAGIEPYFFHERSYLANLMCAISYSGLSFVNNRLTFLIGCCYNHAYSDELISKLAFYKNEGEKFSNMLLKSTHGMLFEPVTDIINKIQQPCLVLIGEKDKVSPYNYLRYESYTTLIDKVLGNISNIKVIRLKDAGHFLMYQDAALFNTEILKYLSTKPHSKNKE